MGLKSLNYENLDATALYAVEAAKQRGDIWEERGKRKMKERTRQMHSREPPLSASIPCNGGGPPTGARVKTGLSRLSWISHTAIDASRGTSYFFSGSWQKGFFFFHINAEKYSHVFDNLSAYVVSKSSSGRLSVVH